MFIIGVTGGIGCGKSTVARIAKDRGMKVLDADEISRKITDVDGEALPEIREMFGNKAIGKDGAMNRTWVASMAFRDKQSLDRLSAILHRRVLDIMADKVGELEKNGEKSVMLDVPIPVKHGFLDLCDQVWVVWTDDVIRIRRLIDRGMSRDDVERRIAVQMTREEYVELADHVFDNNESVDELETAVGKRLDNELKMRGIRLKSPVKTEPADTVSDVEAE